MTLTGAEGLALPPGPVAVKRYVVVLLGKTWRVPFDCTVPRPGSIETDVASVTDQRKVAACPRSIEDGSAVNCATTGAFVVSGAVGGAVGAGGGGGAGLATGGFFLHPAAAAIIKMLIKIVALFRLLKIPPKSLQGKNKHRPKPVLHQISQNS